MTASGAVPCALWPEHERCRLVWWEVGSKGSEEKPFLFASDCKAYILRYMAKYNKNSMRIVVAVTKALADEGRLRMLAALDGRELCVCQLIELLGLAPSTVSKHMAILHQARLVEKRKDGRWIYYRLAECDAPPAVREALLWVERSLAETESVRKDARSLAKILKCDPHELCRKQARSLRD